MYTQTTLTNDLKQLKGEALAESCWKVYEKALRSCGDQVIGRCKHLTAAGLYEKVADLVEDTTLLSSGVQGNLLKMDQWALVLNDSWILGGIHRGANFRLASRVEKENLWNAVDGIPVVTAREILGLLHFGYELKQVGPWQVLFPIDRGPGLTADLIKYDSMMKDFGNKTAILAVL